LLQNVDFASALSVHVIVIIVTLLLFAVVVSYYWCCSVFYWCSSLYDLHSVGRLRTSNSRIRCVRPNGTVYNKLVEKNLATAIFVVTLSTIDRFSQQ